MEFIVSSAALLKGIMDVSRAIPAKTTLPILENFLFDLKEDKLTLTASDQELTLRTVVPVESTAKEGSIAVPARQLTELLKALPDQPLTVKSGSDNSFECIWNNGNSSLPFFPAADYPAIKGAEDDATEVSFPAAELIDGISGTVYATADDEMRPAMNGIYFDMEPDSTTLVASDAHKLICFTTTAAKVAEKASFILHKKPAGVLKAILDKDGDVTIRFDAKTVQFNFGDTMMICRLIVGKYPQYRSVIPQNNPNVLKIDRQQLLNTVRRVSVCANKSSNHIKLDLHQGQLEVTAQDLGFALAAYEKLECDYNGADLSIGFKSAFLIEILANMGCESLVLKFSDSKHSVLILPSEEEAATEKICGILMPIMVS